MTEQPTHQPPVDGRLRIRQANLNKSNSAQQDLINNTDPKQYDILAIQEPFKYQHHSTLASSKWRVLYPTTHFESDAKAANTRSVLFINEKISTNSWTAIPVDSPDVTAVEFRTTTKKIRIFNIYNDCDHNEALVAVVAARCVLFSARTEKAGVRWSWYGWGTSTVTTRCGTSPVTTPCSISTQQNFLSASQSGLTW